MSTTYGTGFRSTVQEALGISRLPSTTEDVGTLRRKLSVVNSLFNAWTENGSVDAALADKFTDGSMLALEDYLRQTEQLGNGTQKIESGQIERVQAEQLEYEAFVLRYMLTNRPVIIKGTNKGWAAARDWVLPNGAINLAFLSKKFGGAKIWATEIDRNGGGYGSGKRHEMLLSEYVGYWEQHQMSQDDRILYLKDWHFASEFPHYQAYSCPEWFSDDWLNDYLDIRRGGENHPQKNQEHDVITSDYRFVYLGPKGSWTPIHADVLRSFSWSTNVAGRKRWRLLPPEFTPLLFDRFGREMAPRFDLEDADGRFPNLGLASSRTVDFEQGVDEALFVPSGWHHTVENIEDTLSINHNWLNGFNIHWGWGHLQQEYASAAAAIEDCRELTTPSEFEELVQRNMAANCGMNYDSIAHFMATIASRQLRRLVSLEQEQRLADVFALHRCSLVIRALLDTSGKVPSLQDSVGSLAGNLERNGIDLRAVEAVMERLDSGRNVDGALLELLIISERAVEQVRGSLTTTPADL